MKFDSVLESFDDRKRCTITRAKDGKTSNWLAVMLIAHHHFHMSPTEFQDALTLQYHPPLLKII